MAHVRVYHPETCEPFDVTESKAADLRLNKGWSSTPWKQIDPEPAPNPEPSVQDPARWRGRGRKRFVAPANEVETEVDTTPLELSEDDDA